MKSLPRFKPPTTAEMRQYWRLNSDEFSERLMLEIQHLRLAMTTIHDLFARAMRTGDVDFCRAASPLTSARRLAADEVARGGPIGEIQWTEQEKRDHERRVRDMVLSERHERVKREREAERLQREGAPPSGSDG